MTLPANASPATPLELILTGDLGYFVLCSPQITPFFFFTEYVFFTILTYDCSYFDVVRIANYHLNTLRTTTRSPQDFSCAPEYVKNGYH